jgi:deoxynucleoside triphosphate triphosphohydrolase SAMHD1
LYELYHVRDQLHRYAYKHKVGCAIEFMLTEVLKEADKYFNFVKKLHKINEYIKLNDSIRLDILYSVSIIIKPKGDD